MKKAGKLFPEPSRAQPNERKMLRAAKGLFMPAPPGTETSDVFYNMYLHQLRVFRFTRLAWVVGLVMGLAGGFVLGLMCGRNEGTGQRTAIEARHKP